MFESCSTAICAMAPTASTMTIAPATPPNRLHPDRRMNRENRDSTRFGHRSIQRHHQACEDEAGWRV